MVREENKGKISFGFGLFVGFIIYVFMYGVELLNPFYDAWILQGGDIAKSYLGVLFFRNSDWGLSFGALNNICYGTNLSILNIDCMPLIALLLKIFSFILPKDFQVIGIYECLSFMLTAGIAACILYKYTKKIALSVFISTFFVMTYIMIDRSFSAISLTSQYILLLALSAIIFYENIKSFKKATLMWSGIVFLSISINSYFFPMCTIIFLGFLLKDYLHEKKIKRIAGLLLAYILAIILTIIFWGIPVNTEILTNFSVIENFSMNLNSFFNPTMGALFLKPLPIFEGQYEGTVYLGLGLIILTVMAFIITFKKGKNIIKNYKTFLPFVIIFVIAFFVALSPKITFGQSVLLLVDYPEFVDRILQSFFAVGRFGWICFYLILFFVLIIIVKNIKTKFVWPIIIIALFIQIADFYPELKDIKRESNQSYENEFTYEFWEKMINTKNINNIVFSYDSMINNEKSRFISKLAYMNDIDINYSYFAERIDYSKIEKKIHESLVNNDDIIKNTAYVFSAHETYFLDYPLNYYFVDGFIVGLKNEVEGYEKCIIPNEHRFAFADAETDIYRNENNSRYVYGKADNWFYLCNLPEGEYKVVIQGNNLLNLETYIFGNNNKYEVNEIATSDKERTYILKNNEFCKRCDIIIRNLSEDEVEINLFEIEKIKGT